MSHLMNMPCMLQRLSENRLSQSPNCIFRRVVQRSQDTAPPLGFHPLIIQVAVENPSQNSNFSGIKSQKPARNWILFGPLIECDQSCFWRVAAEKHQAPLPNGGSVIIGREHILDTVVMECQLGGCEQKWPLESMIKNLFKLGKSKNLINPKRTPRGLSRSLQMF
jgi:hypothetical protein